MLFRCFQLPLSCASALRQRKRRKKDVVHDSDSVLSISGHIQGEILEYRGLNSVENIRIFFGQGDICTNIRDLIYSDIMKCRKSMIRCDDYDSVKGHYYFESYFHACDTPEPIFGVNTRYPTEEHVKPAAPVHLRAFLIALRIKNIDWTKGLIESLEKLQPTSKSIILINLLRKGHHFADIAVQMHYGSETSRKKIIPHIDNNNSLLHLGISINSSRNFRIYHHYNIKKYKKYTVKPQKIGNIYLTSSSQFMHSVSYPRATEHSPIIAIQCRILITEGQELYYLNMWPGLDVDRCITQFLIDCPLKIPSQREFSDILNKILIK